MADGGEYPLLALPAGKAEPPPQRRPGGGGQAGPSKARQLERLEPQFAELQRVLEARNAELTPSALGAGPEHVLVFETKDAPDEFYRAVTDDPNLEWLLDYEERVPADVDFKKAPRRPKKTRKVSTKARPSEAGLVTKYVYMVMFNPQAQTVQHAVLDQSSGAMLVGTHDMIDVCVSCAADGGDLEEAVPYALAVSLEVAPETGLQVYQQIAQRLAARVAVPVRLPRS